ncbi:MAG: divergent polysaccharide deacetylase family protein [Pseudomonadota bacterium]
MRLAGAPLWLLAGIVIGGLAVAIAQGWIGALKPRASQPMATAATAPPPTPAKPAPSTPAAPVVPPSAAATLPPYEEASSAPAVIEPDTTIPQAFGRPKPAAAPPAPAAAPQTALLSPAPPAAPPKAPPPGPGREPAWLAYAIPAPDTGGKPMIAIVIDDTGLDRANSARVIALPGPLTISFMTYAERLDQQSAAARAHGHELLLHVPMEPMDAALNAGPDVLRTDLSPDELRQRLDWDLGRLSGYVGINNHMGSKFSRWPDGMALVMQALRARGLLFLDSRTIADSVGAKEAAAYGVPHADRDVFLDNDQNPGAVAAMLAELERIARKRGFAVGIGHPHPGTIEALEKWLPTLAQRGFVLVPLSAIVKHTNGATG